ncbi:MAG: hypothetical protein ACE5DX_00845 [Candidatus Dojkabacteria bacterium]
MRKRIAGFSLIEIVVVVGAFSLVFASVSIFALDAFRFSQINRLKVAAGLIMQEEITAVLQNKTDLWADMLNNTDDGPKHVEFSGKKYSIADGAVTKDGVTVSFEVVSVMRNWNDDIVETGGTNDLNTRAIDFNATWTDPLGIVFNVDNLVYVSNWNTPNWRQSLESEFNNGTTIDTLVTSTGDGAVELDLESVILGDWCIPSLTRTSYNLTGLSLATSIFAKPGNAYLGTSYGWSGPAFKKIGISIDNPPIITEDGEWSPSSPITNDIYSDGTYVYLATSEDDQEVIILDVSSTPYTQVGQFNSPTSLDARGIFVDEVNDVGYITQGDDLIAFDLSSKTGDRTAIGSIQLNKNGREVFIRGNYAYVAINGGSHEMDIVDISDPANMSIPGYASVNWQSGTSVWVSEDGTRAYLGTTLGFFQREFFIIDTSSKNGSRPTVDSFDTGITSITGLTVIENRAILVGWFGREYQVIDISNENDISRCGSINWNWGINDVASVTDSQGNSWSYILTNDILGEFHAILGGEEPGGGGGNGQGDKYLPSGEFESEVFDTGSTATQYYSISWTETLFPNTDLELQIRAGNTADLSGETWVGPDGTSGTFFTDKNGEYLPSNIQSKQYFQYKAYFTSDQINTPVLADVKINYQ